MLLQDLCKLFSCCSSWQFEIWPANSCTLVTVWQFPLLYVSTPTPQFYRFYMQPGTFIDMGTLCIFNNVLTLITKRFSQCFSSTLKKKLSYKHNKASAIKSYENIQIYDLGAVQKSADQISALFGPLTPYADTMLIFGWDPSLPPQLSADHFSQIFYWN